MMKFDLEPFMGEQIDAAILYLNRFYGCEHGNTVADFYEILEDWDEATWPDDCCIDHGMNSWSRYTFTVMGYNAIDLSVMIQAFLDGYMTNYGFVIKGENGTRLSKIYSSEAVPEVAPYLELIGLTSIEDNQPVPREFDVCAYPNPFNAQTTISYTLTEPSEVTLEIYDILGNLVETLVDQSQPAGHHQISWHANDVSSGMYFYKIQVGDRAEIDKLVLLK
ncbi:MAG: T9SS type A sorting domain-containing protein, partial [candidate division Zixibacteria bacterium]|nr:T9SS type A sorting domain-containing protein [candidate division Zixibacteria bacterium]